MPRKYRSFTCETCGRNFQARQLDRKYCSVECNIDHLRVDPLDRFFPYIRFTPDGCWLWTGSTNGVGYGDFRARGKNHYYVHRWAYEEWAGPIPKGMDLDHLCRNRSCCNPAHLEPVTRRENLERGRQFLKKGSGY